MSRAIRQVYVEDAVAEHPRTAEILGRLPGASVIPCDSYREVFNRRAQSFRLQKKRPALILAEKRDGLVLETPAAYGIGGERNYYFSHMLNCIYDCRYCFLQGMFQSAHYVVFVNHEDFLEEIDRILAEPARAAGEETWFFSGYDCDSLALENLTGFAARYLPFFARRPDARVELRTKSTQIRSLLAMEPVPNAVVAWSFTPDEIHRALEHGVPSVERRIAAMTRLAARGWKLGLRFDPLIGVEEFRDAYRGLFEAIFPRLEKEAIHSVSLGGFRLPKGYFETLRRQYPEERLFAGPLEEREGMVAFARDLEEELMRFCTGELLRHVPREVLFPCSPVPPAKADQEKAAGAG